MRTPIRPLPEHIARWTARARWLRWLDALGAGLLVWTLVAVTLPPLSPAAQAVVAAVSVAILGRVPMISLAWRPVSGFVGLRLSRRLAPGDRAWYVRRGAAELVIVTARRGVRLTIASPGRGGAEGIRVRRTRVLLLSADERAAPARQG